jgi:predicted SAM-dependent methyltransferase
MHILASASNLSYVSADLAMPAAMIKADIQRLPFRNNSFDVILCLHVLEHVTDDIQAMKELYRTLTPSGWGIMQVPIDKTRNTTFEDRRIVSPEEREAAYGQDDHVRSYGLDYKNRLEKFGFSVRVHRFVKELTEDIVEKYGLDIDEDIYLLSKQTEA